MRRKTMKNSNNVIRGSGNNVSIGDNITRARGTEYSGITIVGDNVALTARGVEWNGKLYTDLPNNCSIEAFDGKFLVNGEDWTDKGKETGS